MSSATILRRALGAPALAMSVIFLLAGPVCSAAKGDKPDKPSKSDKFDKIEKIPKSERSSNSKPAAAAPSSSQGSRSAGSSNGSRSSSSPLAATPATAAAAQFEPYRLIVDRNIFNPNRTGRTRSTDEVAAPKVDQIALVGTMESEQGRVAFFDSADPAHQKIVRVGEELAGYTVKEISPQGVQLAKGEATTALRVNQQLRRVAGSDWRVSARDPFRAEPARTSDSTTSATPAVPANASDVLRRLMEQRQKQLKQ